MTGWVNENMCEVVMFDSFFFVTNSWYLSEYCMLRQQELTGCLLACVLASVSPDGRKLPESTDHVQLAHDSIAYSCCLLRLMLGECGLQNDVMPQATVKALQV